MSKRVIPVAVAFAAFLSLAVPDAVAQSQGEAADTTVAAVAAPAPAGLPIFATLGLGFGQRSDACSSCPSPENTDSFTGHLGVGKKLGKGVGVGLDFSVWRRGHPGPLGAADSTGAPSTTKLSNTLGNASVVFSWQVWHVWVRAGGGLALGRQDMASGTGDAASIVTASGMGVGYTLGAGASVPVASMLSLAFFANWNAGTYDLVSPLAVVERGAEHRYLEVGVGLTLR